MSALGITRSAELALIGQIASRHNIMGAIYLILVNFILWAKCLELNLKRSVIKETSRLA
jgi:hypothetical protein